MDRRNESSGGTGNWGSSIMPLDTDYANGIPAQLYHSSKSDLTLREEILSELDKKPELKKGKFTVDVLGGEAFLSGLVSGLAKRRDIESLCLDVEGIHAVNNNLKVYDPSKKDSDFLEKDVSEVAKPKRKPPTIRPRTDRDLSL